VSGGPRGVLSLRATERLSSMIRPHPPLDAWPRQLVDDRFGFAWFIAPAVFVNQLVDAHATVTTVDALHDAIDHVIEVRRAELEAEGGITIIHDWRVLRGYDSEARQRYLDRMRRRAPGYIKTAAVVVGTTPLLRMAVQTANVLMALRTGGNLELATDLDTVLRRYAVGVPSTTGWR